MENPKSDKHPSLADPAAKSGLRLVSSTPSAVGGPMPDEARAFERSLQNNKQREFRSQPEALKSYSTPDGRTTTALKRRTHYEHGRITGPVQVFKNIINTWEVSEHDAVRMLGFEDELNYATGILNGDVTLRGRDPKDRISNLFVIRSSLASLFRDTETENAWLREPQHDLDNDTPLDFLVDGAFEKLLRVRHLVDVMSGKI
jgi:hypothetical protein